MQEFSLIGVTVTAILPDFWRQLSVPALSAAAVIVGLGGVVWEFCSPGRFVPLAGGMVLVMLGLAGFVSSPPSPVRLLAMIPVLALFIAGARWDGRLLPLFCGISFAVALSNLYPAGLGIPRWLAWGLGLPAGWLITKLAAIGWLARRRKLSTAEISEP